MSVYRYTYSHTHLHTLTHTYIMIFGVVPSLLSTITQRNWRFCNVAKVIFGKIIINNHCIRDDLLLNHEAVSTVCEDNFSLLGWNTIISYFKIFSNRPFQIVRSDHIHIFQSSLSEHCMNVIKSKQYQK